MEDSRPTRRSSFLHLPPEIRRLIYQDIFSSPTISIRWSFSPQHDQNIFTTLNPHVAGILSTCRRIYNEASSLFYTDIYFILNLGRNPVHGITAFIEKIGAKNAALITKVAIYRGMHYLVHSPEYNSSTTLWSYARWAETFGPQLQELRLVYDKILLDRLWGGRLEDSDWKHLHVFRTKRILVESKVTLKRHPENYGDVRHWEPSTYRLVVAGAFYRLQPFGNYQYEKLLGTGDNEVKTLLRFSSVEEHRQCTKVI
ncbi:MAG: hypothetical protein LQ337_002625 [Flavoplaca oasis]|nr:MAG: hypothetical protein LQ337_002625 [Flavoplaca oasis]